MTLTVTDMFSLLTIQYLCYYIIPIAKCIYFFKIFRHLRNIFSGSFHDCIERLKKEKQARAAVTAARARAWCRMNVYRVLTAAAAVRTSAGVAAAAGVVVIAAAATKDENENDDPRAVAVAEIASHDPLPPFFA